MALEGLTKLDKGVKITVESSKAQDVDDSYALRIIASGNGHLTLTTFPWDYKMGNHTEISIFNLSLADIKGVGQKIIEHAIKLEMESK